MDDLSPDLARLFEAQEESLETPDLYNTIICKCGWIVHIGMPGYCPGCGTPKAYWKMRDGRLIKLTSMSLEHLNSTIKMLAAKAEQYPAGQRERFEIALDILYAELGTRDKEVAQYTGILSALTKSLENT